MKQIYTRRQHQVAGQTMLLCEFEWQFLNRNEDVSSFRNKSLFFSDSLNIELI